MDRSLGLLLAALLAALGLLAAPALARVTFAGIAGVELGMSEADVRDELGRPTSTVRVPGRDATVLRYRRRKLHVTVESGADRVVAIKTRSRAQRTASGLGVGSSMAEVRRRLRGEKCGTASGVTACSVERGDAVIDFELRRNKVIRVGVTSAAPAS